MQIRVYLFLVVLISLGSCSSDNEVTEIDFGYEYFPLEIGMFKHYNVEETTYNSQGATSTTFQLRELISDTIGGSSELTYLIERSKRTLDTDPWVVDSVWSAFSTNDYAVVVENNIPYQKISFPIADSLEWNGNNFNTRDQQNYLMTFQESDTSESPLLRIVINDIPQNSVFADSRSEFYLKDVGLIEKDYLTLNFCTTGCDSLGQITSGRILKQTLFEYGKE